MTRYPTDRPLDSSAGLYAGGGAIVSITDADGADWPPFEDDIDHGDRGDPGEYADDAWQDEQERRAWHHEMAEPPEDHDDEPDIPPPDEPHRNWVELGYPGTDAELAEHLRARGWQVTLPDPDAGPLTTRSAPQTSHDAARRAQVTGGTVEAHILHACLHWGGWTTDEIEAATGRSHGSVSAAMNRLKRKGLVRESNETRLTRGGSPASVYVLTDIAPQYR